MQDHSAMLPSNPLSFTEKESYTKRNVSFVRELDTRMKNDINAGRRKLFNSFSSGQLRQINFSTISQQNQLVYRENGNNRQLQHERSNPDLANPVQRSQFGQIPEETDLIINKLIFQLNQTKRERDILRYQTTAKVQVQTQSLAKANMTISQLQQIIKQNDFNARQAIANIQQEKEQLRQRNEQMTMAIEHSFKMKNDKSAFQIVQAKNCNRCELLEERIRQIDSQLKALNFKYEKESKRFEAMSYEKSSLLTDLQQQFSRLESQLKSSQQSVSILSDEKKQLETVIFKLRNSRTIPIDQYQHLQLQYENLLQQNKRLENNYQSLSFQHSQTMSQLNFVSQMIYELHLQTDRDQHGEQADLRGMIANLQTKFGEFREIINHKSINIEQLLSKLQEKDFKLKRVSAEFMEFREKSLYNQQSYCRRIQDLELRCKSHQNQDKPNLFLIQEQYGIKIRELTQKNQELSKLIEQKEEIINQSRSQLQTAQKQLYQKDKSVIQLQVHTQSTQELRSVLQKTQQLLKQKEVFANQTLSRLEETQRFMNTVLSHQLQQQTNGINQLLKTNQILQNQNFQLKSFAQKNGSLEVANKQLITEINYMLEQNKRIANKNSDLENALNEVYTQNRKSQQEKKVAQFQLINLRQDLQIKISNLLKKVNESQERQKRLNEKYSYEESNYKLKIEQLASKLREKSSENVLHASLPQVKEQYSIKIRQLTQKNELLQQIVNKQQFFVSQSRSQLKLAENNLILRDQVINQLQKRAEQNQGFRAKLEQTEQFMKTVLSQQFQQQTNTINQLLKNNQILQNQNSELKSYAQKCSSLQTANKQFMTEINYALQQNQRIAGKNMDLENILKLIHAENEKREQERQLLQLQHIKLRQSLQIREIGESSSIIRLNEEVESLKKQLNETYKEQQRLRIQNIQKQRENQMLFERRFAQQSHKLEKNFNQKFQSEIKNVHHIELQYRQKLVQNEATIASLSSLSEKYGEILIKYNTLNNDYQTLERRHKQKEQVLQKQIRQLEISLQSSRKEAEWKIKQIQQLNNQLQIESSTVHKNLQNAESYIFQLMEKLKILENQPQRIQTANVDVNSIIGQVTNQLKIQFNQQKEFIIAKYQNDLISSRNLIKKNEIQINEKIKIINNNEFDVNELHKKLSQHQKFRAIIQNQNKRLSQLQQQSSQAFGLYQDSRRQNQQLKKIIHILETKVIQLQALLMQAQSQQKNYNQNKAENVDIAYVKQTGNTRVQLKGPQLIDYIIQLQNESKKSQTLSQVLKLQLVQQEEQIKRYNIQLSELLQQTQATDQLRLMNQQNDELRRQLDFKDSQIRRITKSFELKIEQISRKQSQSQSLVLQLRLQNQKEIEKLNNQFNSRYNQQVKGFEEQKSHMIRDIQVLSSINEKNQGELSALSQRNTYLQSQLQSSNTQLVNKNAEIQSIKQQLNELTSINAARNTYQTKIRELQNRNSSISLQLNKKEQQRRQASIQTQQLKISINRLQIQLRSKVENILALQITIQQLQKSGKSSSRRKDRSEYKQGLSKVDHELQQSRRQLAGTQNHIKQLYQAIARAQQQIKSLNSYILDLERKSESSSKSESPVKRIEYQSDSQHLNGQIINLKMLNEEHLQKIGFLQSQIVNIAQQHKRQITANTQKNLQTISDIQKNLSKDVEFFKSKLDQAESYIFYLQKKSKQQYQTVMPEDIRAQNEKHTNGIKLLENVVKEKQIVIASNNNKLSELQGIVKFLELQNTSKNNRLVQLENTMIVLESQKEKLSILQAQTTKQMNAARAKIVQLQKNVQSIQATYKILLQKQVKSREEELKKVVNLKANVQQLQNKITLQQNELKINKDQKKSFQQQVLSLNVKIHTIEQSQAKKSQQYELISQQIMGFEVTNQTIHKQLDEAKAKLADLTNLQVKFKQQQKLLNENKVENEAKAVQLQFYKNKLTQAEEYIYRFQNENSNREDISAENDQIVKLQQQVAYLKAQLQNQSSTLVSELLSQIQKSKDSIKDLQSNKVDITNKFNQSQSSFETIQSNLKKLVGQTQIYVVQINRLKVQKLKMQEMVSQTKNQLLNTEAELQFFKNKLTEAEDYIHYLEMLRDEQGINAVDSNSDEIDRLNETIKEMTIKNKQLQNDKNKLIKSLSSKAQELKQVNINLENYQTQLKQALARLEFLEESKKRADEKIGEYKEEIQKIGAETEFFKDKLREAENYINYLEEQKTTDNTNSPQQTYPKDKNYRLVATIASLEANVKNLKEQKEHLLSQIESKSTQLQAGDQQIIALKRERENLIERVTYSQNLLMGKVEKIQALQNQVKQNNQRVAALNVSPAQQNFEKQKITVKLKQRIHQLQQELNLSYNTIQKLKQAVDNKQLENQAQPKSFSKSKFTENPRQSAQFFKNKLLQAESYIESLQKQKGLVQNALSITQTKFNKNQVEIQHLRKQLLLAASDKKVLENSIIELNRVNSNLKESLKIATTQSNTVAVQLNQENNQLKTNLLQIQANSRIQIEKLNQKYSQLKQNYEVQKQKGHEYEQVNVKLNSELQQTYTQVKNLESKIQQTQKQIVSLELIKRDNQDLVTALASLGNLKQTTQNLQGRNKLLEGQLQQIQSKLNILSKENVVQSSQIELLKNKLLSSQRFIIQLQKQLKEKQSHIFNNQISTQQKEKIAELQQRYRQIEMRLILSDQKQKRYLQTIQTQQANLNAFKESLNNAEQQISQVKINIDLAAKKTKEDAEVIKVLQTQINRYGKAPEQEAAYFKGKLLQAQTYISTLTIENKDLKDENKELKDPSRPKYQNLAKQIQDLNQQIQNLHEEIVISQSFKKEAEQNYQRISVQLQHKNSSLAAKIAEINAQGQQIKSLQTLLEAERTKFKEDIDQLRGQLIQSSIRIKQLQQQNQKIQQQNQQREEKIQTLEAELQSNSSQNDNAQNAQALFFKEKLFQAEGFIKELQDQKKIFELEVADFRAQVQILSDQIEILKEKQILSESQALYNSQIQSKRIKQLKAAEQQITLVNSQNLQLKQQLSSINIEASQQLKQQTNFELTFMKDKLYEAESYIVQLQKQNQKLVAENVDNETKIKQLEENIEALNEHVVEAESMAHQLQLEIQSSKQKVKDQVAEKNLAENRVIVQKEQILELNLKLQQKQREIQRLERLNFANERSNLRQKLLEAQSYITQLQRENASLNENASDLTSRLKKIQIQVSNLTQKAIYSDTEKLILNRQLETLREQNEQLSDQRQKEQVLLLAGSQQQKTKLLLILKEKQDLQISLAEEKLKNNIELELLRNQIQEKDHSFSQTQQLKRQLLARNKQLQGRNRQLQQQVGVQQRSISNISKSMIIKEEKMSSIQPLISQLELAQNQIAKLQVQNQTNYVNTSELLEQISRITDENTALNEKIEDLSKIEEEEAVRIYAQLETSKSEKEYIKKQNVALVEAVNRLTYQLSQKSQQLEYKNRAVIFEQTQKYSLKDNISLLYSQKEKLIEKLSNLQKIQAQFENFKGILKVKEEADKQLADLQKQLEQDNINRSKDKVQPSQLKHKEPNNKDLQLSLEQAKKELQNELKQQQNPVSKELQRQIDNLKTTLSKKQEQTIELYEEKVKLEQSIKSLEEQHKNLLVQKENMEKRQKAFEEIEQALVQAESEKLASHQQIQKLRSEFCILFNTSEEHKKQRVRLQTEIGGIKTETEKQVTVLQIAKQALKSSQKVNEDLQNNLRNIIIEYENRIQEYNKNITLLNNRLSQSQTKNEELQSQIKSIIIQEQLTQIQTKQREVDQVVVSKIQSHDYDRLQLQLEHQREHLILAESQLQIINMKVEEYQRENSSLRQRLDEKQRLNKEQSELIEQLRTAKRQKEEILRQKELISQDLTLAEKKISQQEIELGGKEQKLTSSLRRLISITNNQEKGDPQEVLQQLQSFPYLNELITSILYRLKLSSAIQLQKSLKIQSLKNELQMVKSQSQSSQLSNELVYRNQILKKQIEKLRNTIQQLTTQNQRLSDGHRMTQLSQQQKQTYHQKYAAQQQAYAKLENQYLVLNKQLADLKEPEADGKYEELLKQCVDYQIYNKQLEEQLEDITAAHEQQKKKIKEYEQQIQILLVNNQNRDVYQQNLSLREKLTQSQKLASSIKKQESVATINPQQQVKLQFLQICLNKVGDIENEVKKVESQIDTLANRQIRYNLPSSSDYKPESHLMERLQELEQQLIKNAENIREHHQKADGQLYILLKELANDEQIPVKSKQKIEDYLIQLQQQILRQYEQHQNEVAILKEQITRNSHEQEGQFSDRSRQNLLRQIENLNNAIEIYHQESMRRKRVYKRVLQSLLLDIQHLGSKGQSQDYTEITRKIEQALQKNEDQELQFDGQDFMITGGSNVEQLGDDLVDRSAEKKGRKRDSLAMQTEEDSKPFLKFLLSAQDIDKEDLKLLKKKITELNKREIQQNMQILKNKEKKLEQVLQLANKETSLQQIQNIMLTLANNYSRDEISQIFGSEDNDEVINKLNEALCLQESFYRGLNSSILMQQIEERKRKFYEAPTKLSEQVYKHIVGLLTAKRDQEFYEQVDSLFRSIFEIQDGFEVSLRKKDEIYRSHNERMNQIFNRSSSDNSEDYLAELERGNLQEVQLQFHSQRKPQHSEESDFEQSPQRE